MVKPGPMPPINNKVKSKKLHKGFPKCAPQGALQVPQTPQEKPSHTQSGREGVRGGAEGAAV